MTRKRKAWISPAIARLQERRERLAAKPVIQQIVAVPQPPHSAAKRGKPVVEGQAAFQF